MVPNVLKYVEKSQKANCKADAGTILVDLQAQIADLYSTENITVTLPTTAAGATVTSVAAGATQVVHKNKNEANYTVTDGEVTYFSYFNGKFNAIWTKDVGWSGTCMD